MNQAFRKREYRGTTSEDYRYISGLSQKYMDKLRKRFWAKVDRRGPKECWPWTGAQQPRGYGHSNIKSAHVGAHCLSYELNVGPIGDGNVVMHLCDNANCVNPNHLMAGTQSHNINDSITKGRWVKSVEPAWAQESE